MSDTIHLSNAITRLNRVIVTSAQPVYSSAELPGEFVQGMLEAALTTPPCQGQVQQTQLVITDEAERMRALALLYEETPSLSEQAQRASLAIAFTHSPQYTSHWKEEATAVACHLRLQAVSMGLSVLWAHVADNELSNGNDACKYVRQQLNIPYQWEVVCVLFIGKEELSPTRLKERQAKYSLPVEALPWEQIVISESKDTTPSSGV